MISFSRPCWDKKFHHNYIDQSTERKSRNYSDVFIVPQYSEIFSRKEVDVGCELTTRSGRKIHFSVPVMSANMKDVTEGDMAVAMATAGACGPLHRFMSIEENVSLVRKLTEENPDFYQSLFVSVGIGKEGQERARALFFAGAQNFIIDIAHGHSLQMKEMLSWFERSLPGKREDLFIVAGNVATAEAVADLESWGADATKVGVGPGAVCLTKNVTGVTIPQFDAVLCCSHNAKKPVIADGGIAEIGDFAKALGAGATMCMSGKFFAPCPESSAVRTHNNGVVYRGSASKTVQEIYRNDSTSMPTPEGKSELLPPSPSVQEVIEAISGGLRSAFSYSNSRSLNDFRQHCVFGTK